MHRRYWKVVNRPLHFIEKRTGYIRALRTLREIRHKDGFRNVLMFPSQGEGWSVAYTCEDCDNRSRKGAAKNA